MKQDLFLYMKYFQLNIYNATISVQFQAISFKVQMIKHFVKKNNVAMNALIDLFLFTKIKHKSSSIINKKKGCVDSIMVICKGNGIKEQGLNSSQICCIHFHTNTLGKSINPSLIWVK